MRPNRVFANRLGPILIVVTSLLPAPRAGTIVAGGDLESRFRTEAPLAWSKLDALESSIEVVGTMTVPVAPNTERHFRYVHREGKRLYEFNQEKVSPSGVHCATPERAFILIRKAMGGPWAIKTLGKIDAKARGPSRIIFDHNSSRWR